MRPLFFIRAAQDIVCAGVVKIRQRNKNGRWNVPLAQFIIAVYLLRAVQRLAELLLREVPVLPQGAIRSYMYLPCPSFYLRYSIGNRNLLY